MVKIDRLAEKNEENRFWGVLNQRNIDKVVLGNYQFDTWYGNGAYFNKLDTIHECLGYEYSNRSNSCANKPANAKVHHSKASHKTPRDSETTKYNNVNKANNPILTGNNSSTNINDQHNSGDESSPFWLDCLHVCQYCFKYTVVKNDLLHHMANCAHNVEKPTIGKLVYYDRDKCIIRQVRGFKSPLFCQNLALFGKLFLDDKSVYYDIDHFDFYVVYAIDERNGTNFKPMGFFSKEILSWDNDNNLACICIFPPFQRRHLGWLLIEFLYALAKRTPLQAKSGPEFPLSPYGKISYLRFWSVKLAHVITHRLKNGDTFTLNDLSDITGFRKEDILLTLEYMQLLAKDGRDKYSLMLGNLELFCQSNNIDANDPRTKLNEDYILV